MTDRDQERKAIAVAPVMVSQQTSVPVLGLTGRQYRELVRAEGVPHVRRGKLVLARVTDVVAALEASGAKPENAETNQQRLRRIAGLGAGK